MDPTSSLKFTWRIDKFSRLNSKKIHSEAFTVGDYKWRFLIFPKGNDANHLSVYLDSPDSATFPKGWSRPANFTLTVVNQLNGKKSIKKAAQHEFNARESDWGFTSFVLLSDLLDPAEGFISNDTIVVEAEVELEKDARIGDNETKDPVLEPEVTATCDEQDQGIAKTDATDGIVSDSVQSQGELENHARIGDNETKDPVLEPEVTATCDEQDQGIAKTDATDGIVSDSVQSQGELENHARIGDNETKDPVLEPEVTATCDEQDQEIAKTDATDGIVSDSVQSQGELENHARIGDNETKDPVLEPEVTATCDEQDQEIAKTDATDGIVSDSVQSQGELENHARIGDNETKDPVQEPEVTATCDEQDQEIAKTDATDGIVSDSVQSQGELENHARIGDNETKDPVLEPEVTATCDEQDQEIAKTNATDGIYPDSVQSQGELENHARNVFNQDEVNDKDMEICFDEMAMPLLEKLEDNKVPHSVRINDFNEFATNNYVDVGIFIVPASLESYAKVLLATDADIGTGNSPVHYMNEMAFVVLCCALKSMDTTCFSEITEPLILKWRDAIRGALQFGFKVDFLKDHLKSVVHTYLARLVRNSHESQELQNMDDEITAMEKQVDTLKARRSEMYNKAYTELRKTCESTAAKFSGETYSSFLN